MTDSKPICPQKHFRVPWSGGEVVRICGRLGVLKGNELVPFEAKRRLALYNAAKDESNADAAKALVHVMNPADTLARVIDDAAPYLAEDRRIICAVPMPAFVDPPRSDHNRIPWAYAAYLANRLGGTVGYEIIQKARVGRTYLTEFQGFVWQPSFTGGVERDAAYVLVDDVLNRGATLASMRSYIVSQGGTVCAISALAHGSGRDQALAPTGQTCQRLVEVFGNELSGFWEVEIGHDALCLTDAEGRFLLRWAEGKGPGSAILQRLRDRLLETVRKGH
jgi:hypothetical protein